MVQPFTRAVFIDDFLQNINHFMEDLFYKSVFFGDSP